MLSSVNDKLLFPLMQVAEESPAKRMINCHLDLED
jgi:hypothetical protein